MAKYSVSYVANGKPARFDTGEMALGNQLRIAIPGNATGIQIKRLAKTGLAWDPWKVIFDMPLSGIPNTCYKSYGTTLSPQWNKGCR